MAGGSGKIFIIESSGQNWDSIPINSAYPVIQFAENSNGELFAITSIYDDSLRNYVGSGVFFSGDNGLSWTPRNNGLGIYTSCGRIAIDKNDRLYVAASDNYNSGSGGLFISDNNGIEWKHIDITIDGKNAINNNLQVGNTFCLSVSSGMINCFLIFIMLEMVTGIVQTKVRETRLQLTTQRVKDKNGLKLITV
ncbi:MAG: exo-alpha-sialidase [Draconibacterium sp.]|nr:exo-alpha-sialidase [Draconibacterium sp.]